MAAASNFGSILKAIRTSKGMTQQQLADKSGVSRATIADLEQERNDPSWVNVQKLAAALEVDCTAFTDERPAEEKPKRPTKPKK